MNGTAVPAPGGNTTMPVDVPGASPSPSASGSASASPSADVPGIAGGRVGGELGVLGMGAVVALVGLML